MRIYFRESSVKHGTGVWGEWVCGLIVLRKKVVSNCRWYHGPDGFVTIMPSVSLAFWYCFSFCPVRFRPAWDRWMDTVSSQFGFSRVTNQSQGGKLVYAFPVPQISLQAVIQWAGRAALNERRKQSPSHCSTRNPSGDRQERDFCKEEFWVSFQNQKAHAIQGEGRNRKGQWGTRQHQGRDSQKGPKKASSPSSPAVKIPRQALHGLNVGGNLQN